MRRQSRVEQPSAEQVLFRADVAAPPVDVVRVADRFGISVQRVTDAPWHGALDLGRGNEPPCIYVSGGLEWEQQRVVIAHELAHFFLHRDLRPAFRDYDITDSSGDLEEREAQAYADELLMPAPWLHSYARHLTSHQLASRFEVPLDVLRRRLVRLDIPTKSTSVDLLNIA